MRTYMTGLVAVAVAGAPVQAASWNQQASDVRMGAFVGARLNMTLGGREPSPPRAALAIAPAQSRISSDGRLTTRIGEGVALDFTSHSKPTLTLAGVRADRALRLTSQGQVDADQKLGVSTVGWVVIGAGQPRWWVIFSSRMPLAITAVIAKVAARRYRFS